MGLVKICYLSAMDKLQCPICNAKVDVVLVPYSDVCHEMKVVCENEYYLHGKCSNGLDVVIRLENSMVEELSNVKAND